MNPKAFLSTVYLGDRACKKILIDGWGHRFCMQVDSISRLKKGSQIWDYFTDEDINDGWLVFSGLASFSLFPAGMIPNDLINSIDVKEVENGFMFEISIASGIGAGATVEVFITLIAKELSIQSNDDFMATLHS